MGERIFWGRANRGFDGGAADAAEQRAHELIDRMPAVLFDDEEISEVET